MRGSRLFISWFYVTDDEAHLYFTHISTRTLEILTEDGMRSLVPRKSGKISRRVPSSLETVDDLLLLPDLDEPNIFHVLVERSAKERHTLLENAQ